MRALLPMSNANQEPSALPRDERHTMGRIGAAIAAAVALYGAVAAIGPLHTSGVDQDEMRIVVAAAAVIAGAVLLVPWDRLARWAFSVPLLAMTLSIGALAQAADSAGSSMLVLLAFVVLLAGYYLPRPAALVQLGCVGIVLGTRIVSLDDSGSRQAEALRMILLMAALSALFGLVLVLGRAMSKREALIKAHDVFDYQTGLMTRGELERVMRIELARAQRHARPLSVVMVDLSGPVFAESEASGDADRILTLVGRAVLGRIRVEDSAARLQGMRFAIVAPETNQEGAAVFSEMVSEVVRRRLVTLGYANEHFSIAHAWAEFPNEGLSPDELLKVAEARLEENVLGRNGVPEPAAGTVVGPPVPAPARVPSRL